VVGGGVYGGGESLGMGRVEVVGLWVVYMYGFGMFFFGIPNRNSTVPLPGDILEQLFQIACAEEGNSGRSHLIFSPRLKGSMTESTHSFQEELSGERSRASLWGGARLFPWAFSFPNLRGGNSRARSRENSCRIRSRPGFTGDGEG